MLLEGLPAELPDAPLEVRFVVPEGTMPEEYLHGRYRVSAQIRHTDPERGTVGVAFGEPLSRKLGRGAWRVATWAACVLLCLSLALISAIKIENFACFWFDVPVFLYSSTVGSYLLSRFLLAAIYRPPKRQERLPSVTVVIPAFNEEEHIERTLVNALESSYPAELIEFIAVNDGSTDHTLERMHDVRERYPELVVIDPGRNQGKREALAEGIRRARGEVVVFVDSDSFIEPDAVRCLVDGLSDPEVAAVCGHCEVENKWTNTLCKMQAVRYYISFRIMKAAESVFGKITCLSGPLSAYRKSALLDIMDAWLNQTFMGVRATFGDDRSLTTMLMRRHKVIYDSRARTSTIVPEGYRQFLKQQMRWKRSWFRESLKVASFIWREQPLLWISFYLGLLLPLFGPVIVFRAVVYIPLLHQGSPLTYIAGIVLMSGLMSSVYLFVKKSRLWGYGVLFCFFYMLVMVWQMPWAVVTYMESAWVTRSSG
jgi:hyaluronan synthase